MDPDDRRSTLAAWMVSKSSSAPMVGVERAEPVAVLAVACYLLAVVFGADVLDIAVVRTVAGVVLLTILPGYLLVSSLGFDDDSLGRIALYSVGLSVPVVIATALVVNFALPVLGVDRPLSARTLTAAVSLLVMGLVVVRYGRYGARSRSPLRRLSLSASDWVFVGLFTLLPAYSVVATDYVNAIGYESPVIALTTALSLVPLFLLWWRGSPMLYPYAIWSVAVSVLLGMTLVSGHIWGWDIHYEYHTADTILRNGYWDPVRMDATNSLLSITLLASMFSMLTGQELAWVYKAVYPLLASLLPVAIWYFARRQFADRSVAVLAPFVLVFYYGFFKTMPDKQIIAGLFVTLVFAVLLDDERPTTKTWVLAGGFAVGMVLSHYATSLLFIGFLLFALAGRYALRALPSGKVPTARLTRPAFVGFVGMFWLFWYWLTASGVNFYRVLNTGVSTVEQLLTQSASGRSGAGYATMEFDSVLWVIYQFLHVILIGLIGIGILRAVYSLYADRETPQSGEFALLSIGAFAFLVSSVLMTFSMGFDRILLIVLFVLSPFTVVGLTTSLSVGSWSARRFSPAFRARIDAVPIRSLFAVFLAVLFVFSSGTAFALAGEEVPPYSINLNESAGWPVYSDSEVTATRWVTTHDGPGEPEVAVYNTKQNVNSRDGLLLQEVLETEHIERVWLGKTALDDSTYVYLSEKPVERPDDDIDYNYIDARQTPFYRETLTRANKVYSSDNASIYHVPP